MDVAGTEMQDGPHAPTQDVKGLADGDPDADAVTLGLYDGVAVLD